MNLRRHLGLGFLHSSPWEVNVCYLSPWLWPFVTQPEVTCCYERRFPAPPEPRLLVSGSGAVVQKGSSPRALLLSWLGIREISKLSSIP